MFAHLIATGSATSVALDELSHLEDPADVGRIVFAIVAGIDKARMTTDIKARDLKEWRTVFMLSSNASIRAMIEQARLIYNTALAVRALDLPTDGCNDRVPREIMLQLEEGLAANYGRPLPLFVEYLQQKTDYARHPHKLRAEIDRIAETIAGDPRSRMFRAARVLAIAQRAGELAKAAGLLPDNLEPAETARTAWGRFMEGSGRALARGEGLAVEELRKWFDANRSTGAVIEITEADGENGATGYRERMAFTHREKGVVYVKAGDLKRMLWRIPGDETEIARALADEGALEARSEGFTHDYIPVLGQKHRPHYRLVYDAVMPIVREVETDEEREARKKAETEQRLAYAKRMQEVTEARRLAAEAREAGDVAGELTHTAVALARALDAAKLADARRELAETGERFVRAALGCQD